VSIHDIVSHLIYDTKDTSLWAFRPELVLCATIVLMLLIRVLGLGRFVNSCYLALIGSGVALWLAAPWDLIVGDNPVTRTEIFTGMLVYDTFSIYVRSVLLLFAVLFTIFTRLSGLPDREDGPDIYTLVLGATLGMCLMASANHLLMVFMAVEMASVPSYALAAMLKGRKKSSEAALKYAVYGAGTSGIMLYGISLVSGLLHSAHFPTMAVQLAERLPQFASGEVMVLALGGLMIMVGLAFKLSAVPFHFWCPDVFEGATAEVNAFLSVASKAAALALLVRVAIGFGAFAPESEIENQPLAVAESLSVIASEAGPSASSIAFFALNDETETDEPEIDDKKSKTVTPKTESPDRLAALAPVRSFIGKLVAFFAVLTCTFGNLAAYGQTNIKRLMAYSTIAHAGYMMMAIPAVMVMAGSDPTGAQNAVAALCVYIFVYLFMNLCAFSIIAFLRNAMWSEEIADYAGLIKRCPLTTICLSTVMFSLVGLPPLAGFIGKFAIFASLADGFQSSSAAGHPEYYLLVVLLAGGMNTAISLFYYLRVVKTMTMDPEPPDRPPFSFSTISIQGAFIWLTAIPVVLLFFAWNWLYLLAKAASENLLS